MGYTRRGEEKTRVLDRRRHYTVELVLRVVPASLRPSEGDEGFGSSSLAT